VGVPGSQVPELLNKLMTQAMDGNTAPERGGHASIPVNAAKQPTPIAHRLRWRRNSRVQTKTMYGKRLLEAMQARSNTLGQEVLRKDMARIAGVSVQNIGMVMNDAKGRGQKLPQVCHLALRHPMKSMA
jgi:hypothetical protein